MERLEKKLNLGTQFKFHLLIIPIRSKKDFKWNETENGTLTLATFQKDIQTTIRKGFQVDFDYPDQTGDKSENETTQKQFPVRGQRKIRLTILPSTELFKIFLAL